jgi:hypothetical protein
VDDELRDQINIYPNPAQNEVRISGIDLTEISRVRLMDLTGRVVKNFAVGLGKFDISSIPTGVYLIEVTLDKDKVFTYKLVVD